MSDIVVLTFSDIYILWQYILGLIKDTTTQGYIYSSGEWGLGGGKEISTHS